MLEVVRALVDALAARGHISGNHAAELHAKLDDADADAGKGKRAKDKGDSDAPAGT